MRRSRFEARSRAWLRDVHRLRIAEASGDDAATFQRCIGEIDVAAAPMRRDLVGLVLVATAVVLFLLSSRPGIDEITARVLPWTAVAALFAGFAVIARLGVRSEAPQRICVYFVAADKGSQRAQLDALARARDDAFKGEIWIVSDARWSSGALGDPSESRVRCFEPSGRGFIEREPSRIIPRRA